MVAGHPKGLDFQAHSRNPEKVHSPCQVESLDITTGVSTIVYASRGDPMNACSIAMYVDNPKIGGKQIVLGGVFDNGATTCPGDY